MKEGRVDFIFSTVVVTGVAMGVDCLPYPSSMLCRTAGEKKEGQPANSQATRHKENRSPQQQRLVKRSRTNEGDSTAARPEPMPPLRNRNGRAVLRGADTRSTTGRAANAGNHKPATAAAPAKQQEPQRKLNKELMALLGSALRVQHIGTQPAAPLAAASKSKSNKHGSGISRADLEIMMQHALTPSRKLRNKA